MTQAAPRPQPRVEPTAEQQRRIEYFLYHEARLLDESRFEEWLELFTPDGLYWVPAVWRQENPVDQVSIFYEDHKLREVRVMRLRHPRTENMRPGPRTLHQICNVMIEDIDAAETACKVYSTLTMVEYRLNRKRIFAADCRHHLRRETAQESWKIHKKRVNLIDCDSDAGFIRLTIPF